MSPERAKEILQLYRPGTPDESDPEMKEAIATVLAEPVLAAWFHEHCAFQTAVREKVRAVQPPPGLREAILAQNKVVVVPFWQRPMVWTAVAALLILFGLVATQVWVSPNDQFSLFQARMVGAALREYRMDIVTNDMAEIRRYLGANGAPSDYSVPDGLSKLHVTGGGRLTWQNHPVSMVCFNRGDNRMLFLFVVDAKAVANPPPPAPVSQRLNMMSSGSWTLGEKTYFLVGPDEEGFLRKYF